MKEIYKKYIEEVDEIDNLSEKLTCLTSILRSMLQMSVITSFEITRGLAPSDELDLRQLTEKFRTPSDGMPIQILDSLVPLVRTYVNKQFIHGWFESNNQNESMSKRLQEWVSFRNSRPGHGVLDAAVTEKWVNKTREIVKDIIIVMTDVIPDIDGDVLKLKRTYESLRIDFPMIFKGQAIVILSIRPKKGLWKLKGQALSFDNAEEFLVTLSENNVFAESGIRPVGEYKLSEVVSGNNNHTLFQNIPVRQTDIFEGRNEEMKKLAEWLDDEDSRFCLVYGDGGYGKTTLVLELLNQFLESQYDLKEPLPAIVSYHTAKMTQWTEEGLVHFTGIKPAMDECLRELMRVINPILSPDWYRYSGRQLVDKCVGILRDNKFNRDDVILVIDNTETLATSAQEVKDLGAFFKIVGKLIGRIIITSRRREFIEATPIIIAGLSAAEGVRLMQRLAEEHGAKPIIQAGEAKLRKVSGKLMHKPILLEALVKYIAISELGIDAAIENVFRKSNEELLEFLYEDAWMRMNELQKEVFFVLIHITSPLDQIAISKACQEIGIQHTEFQAGLEETHFANLTDYGRDYSIELVELARRFFWQQFGRLDAGEKSRLKTVANNIDVYAKQREKVEKEYRADRVAEAFRSEFAKAAKVHTDNGDIENAKEMYELAVEDDPLNAALHDRYAWFLLNKFRDFPYAKRISKRAVDLDNNNCDAIVVHALVCYRLGEIDEGDEYIDKSQQKGRTLSFCLLRKAISRYHVANDQIDVENRIAYMESAIEFLGKAERSNSINGGYDAKNLQDIRRYNSLARKRLAAWRASRTRLAGLK